MASNKLQTPGAIAPRRDERHTQEIRRISNGFVVRHTRSGPKGFSEHEVYHPSAPNLLQQAAMAGSSGKSPPKVTPSRRRKKP